MILNELGENEAKMMYGKHLDFLKIGENPSMEMFIPFKPKLKKRIDILNLIFKGRKSKSIVDLNWYEAFVITDKLWSDSVKLTKEDFEVHPFSKVMDASNLSLENLKETHTKTTSTAKYLSDSKSSSVQLVIEDVMSPEHVWYFDEDSESVSMKSLI